MRNSAPVITSDVSSMKEIADGASILVDPHDDNKISQSIEKIRLSDVRTNLINKGLIVSEKFTWSKSVSSFIDCVKNI